MPATRCAPNCGVEREPPCSSKGGAAGYWQCAAATLREVHAHRGLARRTPSVIVVYTVQAQVEGVPRGFSA